jgi:FKBP12-rapamycin complex-associated protein
MSVVGYVLGLGDSHPSNIMLDNSTGKILHIDFGDCFEVAMLRDKFPERVPFRLTRMLVLAMEVMGVDGSFRFISELSMNLLQRHKDSVMAMLEAFVHDPLINWRLLSNNAEVGTSKAAPVNVVATIAPLDEKSRKSISVSIDNFRGPAFPDAIADVEFFGKARSSFSASFARPGSLSTSNSSNADMSNSAGSKALSERALAVVNRIQAKLTGQDFSPSDNIGQAMGMGVSLGRALGGHASLDESGSLPVEAQIQRLIAAAMSHENLSQNYVGWCPLW